MAGMTTGICALIRRNYRATLSIGSLKIFALPAMVENNLFRNGVPQAYF